MQFVRWTRVVCCCWTTGAFTSCSRWRPLPSQDVLLRRRLPNSLLLTWVAFPPHPGILTLRHGLLLQGGWRSSTAAGSEAAGQPGMLVGVVQQFVIALLWVQYRSPSVPVIDGHGNDAVQTRGSALVSSVHGVDFISRWPIGGLYLQGEEGCFRTVPTKTATPGHRSHRQWSRRDQGLEVMNLHPKLHPTMQLLIFFHRFRCVLDWFQTFRTSSCIVGFIIRGKLLKKKTMEELFICPRHMLLLLSATTCTFCL